MLAPNVTAKSSGYGLIDDSSAVDIAIGAISTAAVVLLINSDSNDVVKYIPARSTYGPKEPRLLTSECDIIADAPVF